MGSGSHLGELRLKALVRSFEQVGRLLIDLPNPEVFVNFKAMPESGLDEEPHGSLRIDIAIMRRATPGVALSVKG